MPLSDFPGRQKLIDAIDAAVELREPKALTDSLSGSLQRLVADDSVRLPDCVFRAVDGHYARREIHRSARLGYAVVAMTWGPGQGTPVHDHFGMWCVEGVWHGTIQVDQYDLLERDGDRFRFRAGGQLTGATGSAGSLIPPHEYHAIRNPSPDATAVSIHVYARPMERCRVFLPEQPGGEWYRQVEKQLCLDEAA